MILCTTILWSFRRIILANLGQGTFSFCFPNSAVLLRKEFLRLSPQELCSSERCYVITSARPGYTALKAELRKALK